MATVSFSLTTGSTPELEQLGEGAVGVAVVAAPGDVVDGEQHLPGADAVAGELLGVAVHQQPLADRGGRLLAGEVARAAAQAERGQPGGDGAGGDQHDLGAAAAGLGQRVDERAHPVGVDAAGGGGQRRGADLDHDPAGAGDGLPPVTRVSSPGSSRSGLVLGPSAQSGRRAARSVGVVVGMPPRATSARRLAPRARAPYAASMSRDAGAAGRCSSKRSSSPRRLPSTLGAGVDHRLEVEDHRVVASPISTVVALVGAELEQPVLDAEPVEPVGEEADGLVVGEVGLPDPALGLLPRTRQPSPVCRIVNSCVRRAPGGPEHDPGRRSAAGFSARARRDELGHRERQLAQALVARRGDREHL